jgi:hypothetical protein
MTNASGEFEWLGLPPGDYELQAGPDPADPASVALASVTVPEGEIIEADLELRAVYCEGRTKAGPCEGRVCSAVTSIQVTSFSVGLDGSFSFSVPRGGDYWVTLEKRGEFMHGTQITVPPEAAKIRIHLDE